jgi:hypothetical protein
VSQLRHAWTGEVWQIAQSVPADVKPSEMREEERGKVVDLDRREAQVLQPLYVVEELLEVCPDGVAREIKGHQAAEADEDVVGENGQPVGMGLTYDCNVRLLCYSSGANSGKYIIQSVPKVLTRFCEAISREPWDHRNGIGAKRCVSSLSFVWLL